MDSTELDAPSLLVLSHKRDVVQQQVQHLESSLRAAKDAYEMTAVYLAGFTSGVLKLNAAEAALLSLPDPILVAATLRDLEQSRAELEEIEGRLATT